MSEQENIIQQVEAMYERIDEGWFALFSLYLAEIRREEHE